MGKQRGCIVVLQEIFGVNTHIKEVCDQFAIEGYSSIAPAIFDRVEPAVELNYTPTDIERGRAIMNQLQWPNTMKDVQAATAAISSDHRPGVLGYCFGGTVAWVAACRLDLTCAVSYYGGGIAGFSKEIPGCPTLLHFGENDTGIPMTDVSEIKDAHPGITVHSYPGAEHGFNCDHRQSYNKEAAKSAKEITLAFLSKNFHSNGA